MGWIEGGKNGTIIQVHHENKTYSLCSKAFVYLSNSWHDVYWLNAEPEQLWFKFSACALTGSGRWHKKMNLFLSLPQFSYNLYEKDHQWNVNDEKERWEETQPSSQRGHMSIWAVR